MLLLSKAKTHGEKLTATGGSHLTSHDFLKTMEVPVREKEITEKKKDKERRLAMEIQQNQAYVLLAQGKGYGGGPGGIGPYVYSSKDLEVLLKWYNKTLKEKGSKSKRLEMWAEIVANQQEPPKFAPWIEKDEAELTKLSKMKISLKDTALWRHHSTMQRQLFASVATMSPQERENLCVEFENCKDTEDEKSEDEEDEAAHIELQVPGDDDGNEPTDEAAI